MSGFDRLAVIDAEANGLAGKAFAFAAILTDRTGEIERAVFRCPITEPAVDPWMTENVLPAIADIPETLADYAELCAAVGDLLDSWGGRELRVAAHIPWPVEARLLLDVYTPRTPWAGPYPLVDVADHLEAHGHDPTSADRYLRIHRVPLPDGQPHHPLYDVRSAERCLRHLYR